MAPLVRVSITDSHPPPAMPTSSDGAENVHLLQEGRADVYFDVAVGDGPGEQRHHVLVIELRAYAAEDLLGLVEARVVGHLQKHVALDDGRVRRTLSHLQFLQLLRESLALDDGLGGASRVALKLAWH